MRKILFNDKFGLTQAVLDGCKTMTRRESISYNGDVVHVSIGGFLYVYADTNAKELLHKSHYALGEVVAIAQPYKDLVDNPYFLNQLEANGDWVDRMKEKAGWNNKMFVSSYYLPNKIRITDIKVERLQDISDEDCFKEGIYEDWAEGGWSCFAFYDYINNFDDGFDTPREAFASLIDKVSGKGTWQNNPFCFCYEFELVK